MNIELSTRFKRSFRKLHPRIQDKAVAKMKIFKESGDRERRLRVHKLHGEKHSEWAYSVDQSYRISFIFLDPQTILYTDIGTHDTVY